MYMMYACTCTAWNHRVHLTKLSTFFQNVVFSLRAESVHGPWHACLGMSAIVCVFDLQGSPQFIKRNLQLWLWISVGLQIEGDAMTGHELDLLGSAMKQVAVSTLPDSSLPWAIVLLVDAAKFVLYKILYLVVMYPFATLGIVIVFVIAHVSRQVAAVLQLGVWVWRAVAFCVRCLARFIKLLLCCLGCNRAVRPAVGREDAMDNPADDSDGGDVGDCGTEEGSNPSSDGPQPMVYSSDSDGPYFVLERDVGESEVICFGVHKGLTFGEVFDSKPGYVAWVLQAVPSTTNQEMLSLKKLAFKRGDLEYWKRQAHIEKCARLRAAALEGISDKKITPGDAVGSDSSGLPTKLKKRGQKDQKTEASSKK